MFSSAKTTPNAGSRPRPCAAASRALRRVGDPACARALLAEEQAARAAKLGLWGEPVYVISKAEDPAEVLKQRGRFALVEGTVLSVRESGGTIYVNFGRRWSEDFTVTIAKRNERAFSAAGLEPKTLARPARARARMDRRAGRPLGGGGASRADRGRAMIPKSMSSTPIGDGDRFSEKIIAQWRRSTEGGRCDCWPCERPDFRHAG